jgi:opacity protein-like surface antigen
MSRMNIVSVATLALAVLIASPFTTQAAAQVQPSPAAPEPLAPEPESWELTPFVGFAFAGNLENTPATFGAALGYGLTSRVTVEGDLSFVPGGTQGVISEFDTSLWALSANLLYHFVDDPDRDFTPYAAAGLGLLHGNADVENVTPLVEDDTSNVFSWNLGGGVKAAMNERWGIRADLRFFNGDEFAADHWRLYGGVIIRNIGG